MLKPLNCPQCGAPLRAGANKCDYCDTGFVGVEPVFKIDTRLGAACIPVISPGGGGYGGRVVLFADD